LMLVPVYGRRLTKQTLATERWGEGPARDKGSKRERAWMGRMRQPAAGGRLEADGGEQKDHLCKGGLTGGSDRSRNRRAPGYEVGELTRLGPWVGVGALWVWSDGGPPSGGWETSWGWGTARGTGHEQRWCGE
jgi:hypothetical protein